MIGRILVAVGLSVVAAAPVMAQTATPKVDARQERQQQRIDQGVASGELNKREEGRLEREQGRIEADKEAAKADGKVTKEERRKLNREQDRASRHIKREKHDRQKAQ